MHLHNMLQNNVSKAAGLLAAGGIGVYVMMAVRHAGRRSAHTLARGSTTQHAQQNIATVHDTPPSSVPPLSNLNQTPMTDSYMRKKYEVEWRDEWDLSDVKW